MRRADRLFALVQELRRGRVVTAARLADRLEVSVRTVYRDVADLQASGIPIEGEAGVGYHLRHGAELPPMSFTPDEVTALVLGARMTETWGDAALRVAARTALVKIEAAMPPSQRHRVAGATMFAPAFVVSDDQRRHLAAVRRAIERQRVLSIEYVDASDVATSRTVRPLGLFHWGTAWTLGAWCELRTDHRAFRLDRCRAVTTLPTTFELEPPVTIEDFIAHASR